ncbi:HAD-like domain-containing protein [Pilobolus umbonatus]|nr:HAD-like domain-containing protein [Pilobolus umbonatus]
MAFRYSISRSSRIKLITFDAYNTLFKPKGGLSAQYVEEASKYGIHVTKENINATFGKAYKAQLKRSPFYGLSAGMTTQQWWKQLVYATFINSGVQKSELDPKFDKLYHALYTRFSTAEAYTVFPDVEGSLKDLKSEGFQMGVISNSDERVVDVVENLNLSKYFDFVLASSLVGYEKPNKAIFQKALQKADNISPENALHIGDDLEKDYHGATNAGWNAMLLERSKLSYEEFSPAMIADNIQSNRPKKILSLYDLAPYINTMYTLPKEDLPNIHKSVASLT